MLLKQIMYYVYKNPLLYMYIIYYVSTNLAAFMQRFTLVIKVTQMTPMTSATGQVQRVDPRHVPHAANLGEGATRRLYKSNI